MNAMAKDMSLLSLFIAGFGVATLVGWGRTDSVGIAPRLAMEPCNRAWLSPIDQESKPKEPSSGYKRLPPEVAFRKGILALQGRLDLYETNGAIQLYRSSRGYWFLSFSGFKGSPIGGTSFIIEDDGTVRRGGLL
jgi:hypothetical protein